MGTNFFAVIPVKERTINKLQGIVDALKKNPLDINTLEKEELMKRGLTIELANWLSTSVKRISKNEYQFKFQTKNIRELLKSYRDADYWDVCATSNLSSDVA